jgi:hypothetical protein
MKKLIVIALVLLSGCSASVSVDNKAKGSEYVMSLVATTPEGVNVYKVYGNGTIVYVVVNPKTGDVSSSQH